MRARANLQHATPGGVFGRERLLQGTDRQVRVEVENQVVGVGGTNAGYGGIRINGNRGWIGNCGGDEQVSECW